MLTSSTYRQLEIFLKLTSIFCSMPLRFNPKTQLIEGFRWYTWPLYFFMLTFLFVRVSYHIACLLSGFWMGFPSVAETAVEFFFAACLL